MKLHLLENMIEAFLTMQDQPDATSWYFPHALVGTFHENWKWGEPDQLATTYANCLRSDISQRWWKRDQYHPREIMIHLIEVMPELATIAWKDLGNEAASLEGRLDRFVYYCSDLLRTYRQQHPRAVETHHHQDASIISLYLAGMYPETYSLYPGLPLFQAFCKAIGRPDIPVVDDLVRYMKIAKVVDTYLKKNSSYPDIMHARSQSVHKIQCLPYQMSYECIRFGGEQYQITGA